MDFNQQDNQGELLFDHTVRLSHRFGMRLVSACLIDLCLYTLWAAINGTVLMFGLYLGVDGLTLMKVMVVVLVLSIVLLAILGWRYHRKTWLKKLRIIELGDQLSFQVGEKESRYAWSTLRRMSVRSSDRSKYKLDIFFEANTYRIEAWGPACKDLEQVARKLKAYLDQRGDQFDYC